MNIHYLIYTILIFLSLQRLSAAEAFCYPVVGNGIIDLFIFGSILIMGIYHVSLFIIRKKDRAPLYFGLYCILMALFTLFMGEWPVFAGSRQISWDFMMKLAGFTIYLALPIFALFMRRLYPMEFSILAMRFFQVSSLLFLVFTLVAGACANIWIMIINVFFIITAFLYGTYVLILAIIRRKESAAIFFAGFLLLFTAAVNDMLHNITIINTGHVFPFGLLVFILLLSVMLAFRSSKVLSSAEKSGIELTGLNQDLRKKIRDLTEELHAAIDQLVIMNETVVEKNIKLETAQENAISDMKMAANFQAHYLPKVVPPSEEWDTAYFFRPYSGISGDFYDFYAKNGALNGVGIFKVSGSGISPGLVSMIAKSTIFRNFMQNLDQQLDVTLEKADAEMSTLIGNIKYYITGVLLKFDGPNACHVNAGHPDIYVRNGSIVFPVRNKRDSAGADALPGLQKTRGRHEEVVFKTEKNDLILLYTDCLIKNRNEAGEAYGLDRMIESLRNAPENTAGKALDYIVRKFFQFIGSEENITDDLTIIVIKRL